jgi:predicted aspartyl protease
MGVFTYPVEIAASPGGPFEPLDAYVDSGAVYTQVPTSLLRRMGVQVMDTATFVTADGRRAESDIGEIVIRIDGRERRTLCVFGEEDTPALLGAYAQEAFLLGVDPVNAKLIRIEGLRLRRSQ